MYITKYKKEEEYVIFNDLDPDLKPIIFKLEDIPNDNKILNYNLPLSQQKYRSIQPPNQFKKFISDCKKIQQNDKKNNPFLNDVYNRELFSYPQKYEEIHRYIQNEWRRRLYGEWYWIGGKRIFVPGKMCFWMDYWYLSENETPIYKDSNRRYFYFVEQAIADPQCYGIIEVTKRRDGKSKRASCCLYEEITKQISARGGIQSKNDDDARDFYRLNILMGFKKMKFWFQPLHSYFKEPQTELFFEPGVIQGDDQISLRAMIDYKPAKPLAYDGTRLRFYISDEEGKLEVYDAMERWDKVKPVLRDHDGSIIGKSIHTTTVEDGGVHGLVKFKELFDASNYHKKNALGQTQSGLWALFQPAYDGLLVDEFGFSRLEESKKQLEAERTLLGKHSKTYTETIRKYPFTTREAFTISADKCPFDTDILIKRNEYFFNGNPYIIQGDFLWENNIPESKVIFVPSEQGRFNVSYQLPDGLNNSYELIRGKKSPGNKIKFVAGSDTFNYDKTEGQGSKGGGAVFMMFDPVLQGNLRDKDFYKDIETYNDALAKYKTNRFICTYSHRPSTKDEYVEDMIKMCVYYGCFMFPELNFDHVQKGFERRGYGNYLLHKYDNKTDKFKSNSGDVTNENTKSVLFDLMGSHIKAHGEAEFHDDLIKECLKVTHSTMTDYDLFAASAYALYGTLNLHKWRAYEERKQASVINSGKGTKWYTGHRV